MWHDDVSTGKNEQSKGNPISIFYKEITILCQTLLLLNPVQFVVSTYTFPYLNIQMHLFFLKAVYNFTNH